MKATRDRVPDKSCPNCGGALLEEIRPFSLERVYFGNYPFWVCSNCKTVLTPPETYGVLEKVARAKGLFGGRRERLAISQPTTPVKGVKVPG